MIGGAAANRIYLEVLRGAYTSASDTPEEKEYRDKIKEQIDEIFKSGATVELPDEWP